MPMAQMSSNRSSSRHPLRDLYSYFVQVQWLWWDVLPAAFIRATFLRESVQAPRELKVRSDRRLERRSSGVSGAAALAACQGSTTNRVPFLKSRACLPGSKTRSS